MTDDQIAAALLVQKASIQAYVNSADPTQALSVIQMLITAMIGQAGSLENLTAINNALIAKFGPLS